MQIHRAPHHWALTPRQAIAVQRWLAGRVSQCGAGRPIRRVAGVDAAETLDGCSCIAAAVLWDLKERAVVERQLAFRVLQFPYVPGLLSFRETPSILAALRKLRNVPDALMCDAHGFAHPRRFGLACHVGVLCDVPTLGCAKSRLIGIHRELVRRRGARVPLMDDGEAIGLVLRTQDSVKPVFVSVGHKIDLRTAAQVVLSCAVRYRLPEPTRLADHLVRMARVGSS